MQSNVSMPSLMILGISSKCPMPRRCLGFSSGSSALTHLSILVIISFSSPNSPPMPKPLKGKEPINLALSILKSLYFPPWTIP